MLHSTRVNSRIYVTTAKRRIVRRTGPTNRVALEIDALLSARALVDRMRKFYRELERMTDAPITVHSALACIGEEPGIPASRLAARWVCRDPP